MSGPRTRTAAQMGLRVLAPLPDGSTPPRVEAASLDELFRLHAQYIARVAYRLLGSDSEVDDVVQEVFVEASKALESLRQPTAARAWLSRICVRRALGTLRRRRLRAWVPFLGESDPGVPDVAATPEQRAEIQRVYTWLRSIPAEEQVVWVLRHVEGDALEAIAATCELSVSTVQRRLRSAQRRFDEEMMK